MKKSAIAVAVAGLMAAPLALADVTLSGQLQTQLVNYSKNDMNRKGLVMSDGGMGANYDGGNFGALAVTASEDLGDGLKALARYSFNVGGGRGQTNIDTRDAYVGLAGDWGAVLGGRMNHPYKSSTLGWDPFLSTFMQARGNGGMSGAPLHGSETSNALAYAGNFGGVKVVAAAVIDEGNKPASDKLNGKHAYSFSVNAPIGPVELALAYINASKNVDITGSSTAKNVDATKLGAKWSAGDFSLAGQIERLGKGMTGSGKAGNIFYLTGSYALGNNTLSASFGSEDKKVTGLSKRSTYVALGASHAFSKNTSAFVGYRGTEYKDSGWKAKQNAFGAGLRVKF